MNYPWQNEEKFSKMDLPLFTIKFNVKNMEEYESQNYPEKPGFKGSWRNWIGIKIDYIVDEEIIIEGSRGKTTWYIPAKTEEAAKSLKIKKGQALKIIKYIVKDNLSDEYTRLKEEYRIQYILSKEGLAPKIYDLVLIRNTAMNKVKWFDEVHYHPENSIYFALVIEHLEGEPLPEGKIDIEDDYKFYGPLITQIKEKCEELGIMSYDLGIGNVLYSKTMPKVIDFHKWRLKKTYFEEIPKAPKYLQIELNNICNANCQMCVIPDMNRKKGYMTNELYDDILKQAKELEIKYISPFLHGEPFIRKDFIEKVNRINKLAPKAKIHIFTNASLLKKNQVDALKEVTNLDLLSFSFPGGTKESYEKITGLNFYKTIENIKYAIVQLDIPMKITMPLVKDNIQTSEEFYSLWNNITKGRNKDVDIHTYDTYNYLGDFKESLAPNTDTICDRILRSMTILWDGKVGLCCMDAEGDYLLGDAKTRTLYDIWNGYAAVNYRKNHIKGRKHCEPCNRCNQRLEPECFGG